MFPDCAFRLVCITSGTISGQARKYAQSPRGEGLILIDGQAAAEMSPVLSRAAHLYANSKTKREQSALVNELIQRNAGLKVSETKASTFTTIAQQCKGRVHQAPCKLAACLHPSGRLTLS